VNEVDERRQTYDMPGPDTFTSHAGKDEEKRRRCHHK